jgi:hypothetical protein
VTPWPLSVAFPLTLLGGIVLVIGFDAASAWLTRGTPEHYRRLWPVQFALYVVIGFAAMLTTLDLRLVEAIGALCGFAASTVGWAITWRIGPSRVEKANPISIALVVASMTAFGLGLAVAGALIFNLVARLLMNNAHH